jgi:Eco47II restriction endonuclease
MAYLNFISDVNLMQAVLETFQIGVTAKTEADSRFQKNVVDPFAMLFEMACIGLTDDAWLTAEKSRQAQKTLSNKIGLFHQEVLGAVAGWENLGTGGQIDLVCRKRKIIAEVKNKYNTIKGSDQIGLHRELKSLVMNKSSIYKGYTAYYVEIIPKKPMRYDKCFTPTDKEKGEKVPANELIRQIDGASFYALVTGRESALAELYAALPAVLVACGAKSTNLTGESAQLIFKVAFEK